MIADCRHSCSCLSLLLILLLSLLLALGCKKSAEVSGQLPAQRDERAALWFEDATARTGPDFIHQVETSGNYLVSESLGSGGAFLDFDNDGRLDIYLIQNVNPDAHATIRLFRNSCHHESAQHTSLPTFVDVSAGSGLDVTGYGNGLAIGDVNNDGLPEVLITEYDRIRLFLNNGDGKFTDVTAAAGLTNLNWSVPAAFVDYDRDGWLDLVIGNYLDFDPTQKCPDARGQPDFCGPHGFHSTITRLYRNLGGRAAGTSSPRFEDVTIPSGLARA